MKESKVFYTDFRVYPGSNLTLKLQKLCKKAGFDKMDMEGKFVAIKMHFGELGNLAFIRPNYAKAIADMVKEKGGMPFLTDSNTLYPGSRKHALEHLDCANINGFNTVTTGCQIIIGDGLRGTDDIAVPVKNGEVIKEAYIGRAVMDADIVISLNHFKGHEMAGFGGAVKNLGMGCASRAGKMDQHSSGKPIVSEKKCRGCKRCFQECAAGALSMKNKKAMIDQVLCTGCGRCIGACSFDAIKVQQWDAGGIMGIKMAEYTQAICQDRPHFHISMVMDISPNCDCHGENDAPILPDIGMFASYDPIALDQACVDACQAADPLPNSQLSDNLEQDDWHCHHDHFKDSNPNVSWRETLEHGEKIGLGTRSYDLTFVK